MEGKDSTTFTTLRKNSIRLDWYAFHDFPFSMIFKKGGAVVTKYANYGYPWVEAQQGDNDGGRRYVCFCTGIYGMW